jgi:hypothetical protein
VKLAKALLNDRQHDTLTLVHAVASEYPRHVCPGAGARKGGFRAAKLRLLLSVMGLGLEWGYAMHLAYRGRVKSQMNTPRSGPQPTSACTRSKSAEHKIQELFGGDPEYDDCMRFKVMHQPKGGKQCCCCSLRMLVHIHTVLLTQANSQQHVNGMCVCFGVVLHRCWCSTQVWA